MPCLKYPGPFIINTYSLFILNKSATAKHMAAISNIMPITVPAICIPLFSEPSINTGSANPTQARKGYLFVHFDIFTNFPKVI